ncbi:MAG TPA: glycosyltransferase family 4 protein [Dehalococcoidia bacterium]|nr:glycosyltransferase family 4 protein [Dehalococcoidia bacterium]
MRIAIAKPDVTSRNAPFQAEADLWRFISEVFGCWVTVFSDLGLNYMDGRLRVKPLRRVSGTPWFPPYPGLLSGLRGFDVIVTADPSLYAYAYWAAMAALTWNARLVLDTSMTLLRPPYRGIGGHINLLLAKAAFGFSHRVIVPTALAAERLVKLGLVNSSTKIVELGHPADTNLFRPDDDVPSEAGLFAAREGRRPGQGGYEVEGRRPGRAGYDRDGINILSVGRLAFEKGHHVVVQALAEMLKFEGARLVIAGEGPYRQPLMDLCRHLGVADRVSFLGLIPRDELPALYSRCDIFVQHPVTVDEWEESFGIAVVEAMACGLPVVVSNCGALEHVVPEDAGFLVGQQDKEALREKVELLRDNPALRAEMGARGRAHVCQRYSVQGVARRCYEEVLC